MKAAAGSAVQALLAAVEAGEQPAIEQLVYVDDTLPGWRREHRGDEFVFLDTEGRVIRDEESLRRIRSLAIPPAYENVWICPLPEGHLQATGRDARGRKQYRYHPLWQALRDADKFDRMRAFALALPRIRRAVARDLKRPRLPKAKVLATIVRLLDTTYLRVGNEEYTRSNGSYGLTTLRNRHAAVNGGTVKLSFRGKSGVRQQVQIDDPRIARIVRHLQDLPGQELFQYLDDEGHTHSIGSAEVNEYLRTAAGGDFTAKDFRTWHASALALERLADCEAAGNATQAQRCIKEVIGGVASQLGHTVSVCRKAYVHPLVLSSFAEGRLHAVISEKAARAPRGLKESERRLLALLRPHRRGAH